MPPLDAVNVSVALPPAVLLMALLTVIFPVCVPPGVVKIVTLVPEFNELIIVLTFAVALLAEVLNVLGELLSKLPFAVVAVDKVTFAGSSNHVPASPRCALALTEPIAAKYSLPDVSTKPPLPPSAPPRAKIFP